ncbi:hypothetical protein CCACVL1_24465 [Corchorus capsularis]|uniref:Uncharacterized protein n=1 Tax=Corchorus capsularis TaxID=210143 RepID=A0A1R3GPJ6_COCAP|nr:hypothetical protein CCACVL1_24465 [Corchorus capsularis]
MEGDAEIEKLLSELNLDKVSNVDKDSHDHDHQDYMDNEQEDAANPIEAPTNPLLMVAPPIVLPTAPPP